MAEAEAAPWEVGEDGGKKKPQLHFLSQKQGLWGDQAGPR